MKDKANQPKSLQDAITYFADADRTLDYVARLRWPNGVIACPSCGRNDVVFLKNQRKWQCKSVHPKRQFSAKVGTIFEDSPISLDKWMVAVWMLCNCRNGVSSYELARTIRVTQKSAWFMLHRVRVALRQGSFMKIGGSGAPIEVDETFIGGEARFMHKSRKVRMNVRDNNWSKTVVMGMLERGGKVRAAVIPHRKGRIVEQIVRENVLPGSEVHTDEFLGYSGLSADYQHKIINHLESYVNQNVHTQGIENFWSLLKRQLTGTYVSVEPFHLFRYVDEQAFRFNNRKDALRNPISDAQRFNTALSQIAGKRLTYAELTGKLGETQAF